LAKKRAAEGKGTQAKPGKWKCVWLAQEADGVEDSKGYRNAMSDKREGDLAQPKEMKEDLYD
jgi:hypothetical protein